MNCLTDYIGVRGCGAIVPDSNLYINSLPSINLNQLQKLADSDQEDFKEVWNDIQARSQSKLLIDVSTRLRKRFKLNSFIESFKTIETIDTAITYPPLIEERGFTYNTRRFNDYYIKSSFFSTNVEYIKLYLSAITINPIAISIKDYDTNEILFTTNLTASKQIIGWNLIKVNKSFLNQKIKFVYDATEVTSVSTSQNHLINHGCGCVNDNCGGLIMGLKDVATSHDSFGLSAKISLNCTYEPLICSNKELFSGAFLYLLGAELMIERLHSDRLNEYTTVLLDDAKELKNYFLGEYDNGLDNIVEGISIDTNDCCIACNASLKVIEQTP